MAIGDLFARLWGEREQEEPERVQLPAPPTAGDLTRALDETADLVAGDAVPSVVTARVERVIATVRDTLPRLDRLGVGSPVAYSVVATASDYLPEAVTSYLRLPRRFADTRPVDGSRTSLMVLVDQLDLLGRTMDRIFEAVHRDDAAALVAHGRFLAEKFGHGSRGGTLEVTERDAAPLPTQPPGPAADAVTPLAPPEEGLR